MPLTYLCETVWITRGSNSQLRFVWQEWDGQCVTGGVLGDRLQTGDSHFFAMYVFEVISRSLVSTQCNTNYNPFP